MVACFYLFALLFAFCFLLFAWDMLIQATTVSMGGVMIGNLKEFGRQSFLLV